MLSTEERSRFQTVCQARILAADPVARCRCERDRSHPPSGHDAAASAYPSRRSREAAATQPEPTSQPPTLAARVVKRPKGYEKQETTAANLPEQLKWKFIADLANAGWVGDMTESPTDEASSISRPSSTGARPGCWPRRSASTRTPRSAMRSGWASRLAGAEAIGSRRDYRTRDSPLQGSIGLARWQRETRPNRQPLVIKGRCGMAPLRAPTVGRGRAARRGRQAEQHQR